jgi:hypothetical protein
MRADPLSCRLDEPARCADAQPGHVPVDVLLEDREHRRLEQHAVEPPLTVPAEGAARRVGLVVGELRFPQRRRVQHAACSEV